MKEYKITAYFEDNVETRIVRANSKEEAEQIGWEIFCADDIYVSEVR